MLTPDPTLHCERDGFPLVEIGGELYCSVEYIDGMIGGLALTTVEERDGYLVLVFENGGWLPLTCTCCGGRLHLRALGLADLERMLGGRKLEGFRHGEYVGRGVPPRRHPIFALQFSGAEDASARTIQVHLESLRRLVVPGGKTGSSPLWN
jgi:hypothetical protein